MVLLGYTAVHLVGFVVMGLAVAGLFALAERERRVLSQWLGQAVTPAIFLGGHVLGAGAMVGALAYFHGRLLRHMPEALDGE